MICLLYLQYSQSRTLPKWFSGKLQKSQVAGAFDGTGQLALMFGAGSGLSARADFTFFGNKSAEYISLLVVHNQVVICTKLADARLGIIPTWARRGLTLI